MLPGNLLKKILVLLICLPGISCVKDVDLDQARDIAIPPTAALDLVYFELDAQDFIERQVPMDQTRLDFLDDDYIQESLMEASFTFDIENTFAAAFEVRVAFLAPDGTLQHDFEIPVPGAVGAPATVNYTELVPESQIGKIRRSLIIRVSVAPVEPVAEGTLNLESKGLYKFEFK